MVPHLRDAAAIAHAEDALDIRAERVGVVGGELRGVHRDGPGLDHLDEVHIEGLHALLGAVRDDLRDAPDLIVSDQRYDARVRKHDLHGGHAARAAGVGQQPLKPPPSTAGELRLDLRVLARGNRSRCGRSSYDVGRAAC